MGNAGAWPDRMIFSHWGGKVSVRTQRFRLDNAGGLFDMELDPGQDRDVAQRKPRSRRPPLKSRGRLESSNCCPG